MGDRLRADKPLQRVIINPRRLSSLHSARQEMSSGQKALMLCGWDSRQDDGSFQLPTNVLG